MRRALIGSVVFGLGILPRLATSWRWLDERTLAEFVPHANGVLIFAETSVTDQHWSIRKGAGSQ